jgi:hypothetical protein
VTDASDPAQPEQFDAEPILAVLERHGVAYVIVGGYAARMHGSTRPTRDVDVTPATTRENLDRLAAALRELDAHIRTDAVPEGLPFSTSGEALAGHRMLNLQTRHGELDLTIRPAGFEGGYDELIGRSGHRSLGQIHVRVAALEDVIRSKEAAARDKDIRALPELYRLANMERQPPTSPGAGASQTAGRPASERVSPADRIAAARAARRPPDHGRAR